MLRNHTMSTDGCTHGRRSNVWVALCCASILAVGLNLAATDARAADACVVGDSGDQNQPCDDANDAAIATADDTTAVGEEAEASGTRATALGQDAEASGTDTTALGQGALADATNATAVGQDADAGGIDSTALGQDAFADKRAGCLCR